MPRAPDLEGLHPLEEHTLESCDLHFCAPALQSFPGRHGFPRSNKRAVGDHGWPVRMLFLVRKVLHSAGLRGFESGALRTFRLGRPLEICVLSGCIQVGVILFFKVASQP